MENVTGIGGVFFRARDPASLSLWYQKHLGIALTPSSYDQPPWQQEAGPTAFAPFPATTDYFGDAKQVWMINFRVRNLDRMVAQLQAANITVKVDPERYPNGRFARLHDPEGNPIELWEPGEAGHYVATQNDRKNPPITRRIADNSRKSKDLAFGPCR